ncbi:heterokaryon incompatibility protein-domain-containing protein [Paraphoma chrysanthemicola]|uniref:Heterokaryon incompatibility protein-domain-containing protein n=1 Tax=Paraphoma chrysanthemicola TaxID=798071 RepID=A0A8K0W2M4_9PLEO|nr:heterokaryon incompatibility protein-domain-containing protein [Paraphoma chrysanthemicola]
MNSASSYVYTALHEPDRTIRLIKIVSIEPHICCELIVVPIETAPIFSALSYVWGDTNITDTIYLHDRPIQVTINLVNALRDVMRHWSEGEYTDDGDNQWLWADAICINQNNTGEKNHQVPLMEKIYSGAARVFAWLGVESKEGCAGIDAINVISNETSKLPGVEVLLSKIEDGSFDPRVPGDLKKEDPAILMSAASITWLVEHHAKSTASNPAVDLFDKMQNLFSLPYWSRIWVFQETVLAQEVIIICGKRTTDWSTVCNVLLWIFAVRECHSVTNRPHEVAIVDWFALVTGLTAVTRCGLICYARWASKRLQFSKTNPLSDDAAAYAFMARYLSIDAHNYRATDPKDYVYSMRAVVGSHIHTDYSPDYTVAQVYHDYVREWFEVKIGPSRQQIRAIAFCNLWFLQLAGVGYSMRSIPGLPSWAPNFMGAAELDTKEAKLISRLDGDCAQGVFPSTMVIPRLLNSTLECTAAIVAEIDAISPAIYSHEMVWERVAKGHEWLLWIYQRFVYLERYEGHGEGYIMFKDIVYALSATHKVDMDVRLGSYEQLLLNDLQYAFEISTGLSPEDFYDSLRLKPHTTAIQSAKSPLERIQRPWEEADSSTYVNQNEAEAGHVVTWVSMLLGANRLRLVQLDRHHCGLFPPLIQKGDTLAILEGYSLPVVLRRSGESYVFVGGCNVPMLSDPKKNKKLLETGQARLERINII